MNEVIGPVSYGNSGERDGNFTQSFSERTGEILDNEVRKMITPVGFLASALHCSRLLDL